MSVDFERLAHVITRVNLERLVHSLRHIGRKGFCVRSASEAIKVALWLISQCGDLSQGRQMLHRLATILLTTNRPRILVPISEEYLSKSDMYSAIEMHLHFLKMCCRPEGYSVTFVIPDNRLEDRRRLRISSIRKDIRSRVHQHGWEEALMTELIPNVFERELWVAMKLQRLSGSMGASMQRARHVVLGRYAAQNGFIICDYTPPYECSYRQAGAAFLHNPGKIPC